MKRIMILSNVSLGLANFRRELLEELTLVYEVIVVASDNGGRKAIEEIGCQYIEYGIERHGLNPLKELMIINGYKKLIKEIKPFVILSYTIKPNIYGGIACCSLNIPYIANVTGLGVAIENPGILAYVSRKLYKIGLKKAHMVFFQNKSNQKLFLDNDIYNGPNMLLPGSGVNLSTHCYESYPQQEKDSPIVFCVVGRITKDKGINEIIEASKSFTKEVVNIQLIGNCEENYLPKIQEAEKAGVITYHGRQKNVHEWLKKANAILHASYHEGMSNVLLEAAACGRPILATKIPGCMETFEDGVTGIGFMPKSADEIVKAIKKFMDLSYTEMQEMGINGRKRVEKYFDRQIVINKYIEQIESIRSET